MYGKRTFSDLAIVRMLPAAWIMATIWWLSDRETLPKPPGLTYEFWSILAHIGVFGLLGLAVWWALGMNTRLLNRERNVYAIAITTAYGVLDEIHQYFVPGRKADPLDVLADFVGALVCVLVIPKIVDRYTI